MRALLYHLILVVGPLPRCRIRVEFDVLGDELVQSAYKSNSLHMQIYLSGDEELQWSRHGQETFVVHASDNGVNLYKSDVLLPLSTPHTYCLSLERSPNNCAVLDSELS